MALGLLFSSAFLFAHFWDWPATVRWAAPAAALWIWVLIRLETLLDLNRRPSDHQLRPSLGAANAMTLGRGVLVAALAGFLFQSPMTHPRAAWLSWLPGAFYLIVALVDAVDGWTARTMNCETLLGEILDTEVDALGILVTSFLLVSSGRAPLVFASVGLGYYLIRMASRLRSWRGLAVGQVQPRPAARMVAGCQMGFAATALLPIFDPVATFPVAYVMTAAFWLGMATDWFIICGQATPCGQLRQPRLAAWQTAVNWILPLFLRAAVAIGIVLFISEPCFAREMGFLSGIILLGLLCVLGVAVRLAAVILSLMLAHLISVGCNGADGTLALAAAVSLMMAGAGHPRIWQPEDIFFLKRRK